MANVSPRLPPPQRRRALEQLSIDRLTELTGRFGVSVSGNLVEATSHIDALIRSRRIDFADLLALLKREELQAMCDAVGVDRGGREKQALVERILAASANEGEVATGTDPAEPKRPVTFALTSPVLRAPAKQRAPARAPRRPAGAEPSVEAYRFDETRKNNPPAGLVEFDRPPLRPTKTYSYDPHLDPTLEWAGKAERTSFDVDTVSLHIHERISTEAILRAVRREPTQRSLFGETSLSESKEIDFYAHDVGWSNRMILGDSLLVMNSLLEREHMAGQVQCIYLDPPYGVKFNSNFQPFISSREVKDGDDKSLTREPEQIQAYRDTWTLGVHSYLTYLRDRLLLARELLADTGSLFVQISDENVHYVRSLLGETFGEENFCGQIAFKTTSSQTDEHLASVADHLLWYAKNHSKVKYRQLFNMKGLEDDQGDRYTRIELPSGSRRPMTTEERSNPATIPEGSRIYCHGPLTSSRPPGNYPFVFEGRTYTPGKNYWKTNEEGMKRLAMAGRLAAPTANSLRHVRFLDDFPCTALTNIWTDTQTGAFTEAKSYVVQTNTKVVSRCILMTSDPGDLVLDATCGSGTTALVAEQWGRRWIVCDTSRVAIAVARKRIMTAKLPYYLLRSHRVRDGFVYRTVPHVTLKSIARNAKLDSCKTREEREHLIRESAEQELLYDQPEQDKNRIRVSGPFTVEAIPVAALHLDEGSPIPSFQPDRSDGAEPTNRNPASRSTADDYVGMMVDLLKKTGIQFLKGKNLGLTRLRPVKGPYEYLHAESELDDLSDPRRVAVSFGPRHAPVTPIQVRDAINETRGYDIVLFVGFACDPEARRIIDASVHGRELQFVAAAPDILVSDLLKTTKATKLFTVFGAPDVKAHAEKDGMISLELLGVDLYDPNTGETHDGKGSDVAAWFVDQDYDGKTFLVSQALFPNRASTNPWEKLQKALKGTIDEDTFEALRGTRSLPFKPGKRVAITVIDDRGNEVIKIIDLHGERDA